MKINSLNSAISFKRSLTKDELSEYRETLNQARKNVGGDGKSILIVHDVCLPQDENTDTGVGHLTSKTAEGFFDFAKNYWGINAVEVLPQGEVQLKNNKSFYNSYNGSALSLGSQNINLELLVKDSLLPADEFFKVVSANYSTKTDGLVNYENVIGQCTPYERALKIAYDNFISDKSPERAEEKAQFEKYKEENADWLDKKAIYFVLKQKNDNKNWAEWSAEEDKTLFDGSSKDKDKYIKKIKTNNQEKIDFYKFKQFIADKHLALGRKKLNDREIKLFGDCLIGFSDDEVWANKSAFEKDKDGNIVFVGDPDWKLPALNYSKILENGSASNKLLKRKVELFAKRYDGIRFDCSWAYVSPKLSNDEKYNLNGKVLDIIEDTVKKVKGKDYNKSDLIHEFEADKEVFSLVNYNGKIKSYLADRVKVVGETYMSDSYGSTVAMDKLGADPEHYVIGVGNHDPQPLRQIAESVPEVNKGKFTYRKNGQTTILGKIFNVSPKALESPAVFSQYKFAEPLLAKNQMVFYMDAFGRSERFDSQADNKKENYRYRIPVDYAQKYQEAVQSGFGYSPLDGYSKVFKKKGLDETKNDLYEKIVKYKDILKEKTGVAASEVDDTNSERTSKKGKVAATAIGVAALIAAVILGADSGLQAQAREGNFTIDI